MDSDSSVSPLLSLACRFLPHDQWFTTHVDPDWKVKQVKSWLLAKCLPYAAPPSPPLRQSARKPQRPPSPITFAPDPRHRPISPITFAMPKQKTSPDDASEYEEPPADDELSAEEQPEEILPPVQPKKRAILPTASTSAKGDLYSQFTLIRFSTGQLLEDDLPLSFYDMQADELLEVHRVGVVVTLPRAHPTRYLDAYWEGWVRVLRMRPIEEEEDSWMLYKIRQLETRQLEWRDRWLVVREGSVYLCRDENRLIHTLSLADLVQLTNSGCLPPSATPSSKTRVLLARFSALANAKASSTRASSPTLFDNNSSDSSSNLSSPVFAQDSSDSNRRRRKHPPMKRSGRKRPDPEFLALDMKDDAAYVSLLRVLHRHALPRHSTFVDKLPVGSDLLLSHPPPPRSAHPDDEEAGEDDVPPPLRHPPSLAHLRAPPRGLSLGALPFPEWRTALLQRARRAGLGRIGKAVEWVLWHGDSAEESAWMLLDEGGIDSPVRRKRGRGRRRIHVRQPTSTDGYDSDVSGDGDASVEGDGVEGDGDRADVEEDSDAESSSGRGTRSETEWVGWMGDLRRQTHTLQLQRQRAHALAEARRRAEESRDAELGLPPLPPGAGAGGVVVGEVTIVRVGTGVDDRQRRAALEPSAVVTSLSGVNPPSHPLSLAQALYGHGQGYATPSASSSQYSGSAHAHGHGHGTPVLSSPSSSESIGFAFSPLAPPAEIGTDAEDTATATTAASGSFHPHYAHAHSRAHSHTHTLLHSVSMHDVMHPSFHHPSSSSTHLNFPTSYGGPGPGAGGGGFDAFARRPSMPVIGSAARWGEGGGSRPSSTERGERSGGNSTGITEVPRASGSASVGRSGSISGGKGLLRKKDPQREREWGKEKEEQSDWRKGKERERERSPPAPTTTHATAPASRRPRLSVSTTDPPRPPRTALSPPGTPLTEHTVVSTVTAGPAPGLDPPKKKRRGLARGVSIRAEKFVKSLDSALDFVDGK